MLQRKNVAVSGEVSFFSKTHLRRQVEHLEEVVGMVQGNFPRHRDVGQGLLQGEDVAAHSVDNRLVYSFQILGGTHENLGYQVTQAFKHVLQHNRNLIACFSQQSTLSKNRSKRLAAVVILAILFVWEKTN